MFPNAGGGCSDIQNAVEADAIYTVIPKFQDIGVDCEVVEDLRTWAKEIWPKGDWDRFIQGECTGIYITSGGLFFEGNDEAFAELDSSTIIMSELDRRDRINIYFTASANAGSFKSELFKDGSGIHTYLDNSFPFSVFGEGVDYTNFGLLPGNYQLEVLAMENANGTGDTLDKATYYFNVEKGVYFEGLNLINQQTGALIRTMENGEEYDLSGFPSVLMNLGPRVNAYEHIGSVYFNVNDGEREFVENGAPFLLYGKGANFEPWSFEAKEYVITAMAYEQNNAQGVLIDSTTYRFTVQDETVSNLNQQLSESLNAFPNPAHTNLYLDRVAYWEFYNANGQLQTTGSSKQIDVSQLPRGLYYLKSDGKSIKIIVQ
jgi:hypothetical protein